ncbi:MAG: hypothetical protein AAFU57_07135 [Bacteroidota bacterium]
MIENLKLFFNDYANAWQTNDINKMVSFWDDAEQDPFYKAEEILEYYHDLDTIKAYWEHNHQYIESIRLKFFDIRFKPLPGGYGIAFAKMNWYTKFVSHQKQETAISNHVNKEMGGDNHVLALVKDTPAGLKFVGWNETPDAPLTYMKRLYEQVANPELDKDS